MGTTTRVDGTIDMRNLYNLTDDRLYTASHPDNRAIRGKPRSEWPDTFTIAWDYSRYNHHRALDGVSADEFLEDYGDVLIGEADFAEIDGELHGISRRDKSELWMTGQEKVARCILYWSNGLRITPPMLAVSCGKLVIVGGNNRIAVCRADDLDRLPFLFCAEDRKALAAKLPSLSLIQVDDQEPQGIEHV